MSDSEKGNKEGSRIHSPNDNNQYLQVPNQNYGLGSRLDFILRKRTRLLEKQKTK